MFYVVVIVIVIVLAVILSNKTWTYQYGDYTIRVKNTAVKCVVYANDKMIAEGGMFKYRLTGKLDNGKEVRIKIGQGLLGLKCTLYIDGITLLDSKSAAEPSNKLCKQCGKQLEKFPRAGHYYCLGCGSTWEDLKHR